VLIYANTTIIEPEQRPSPVIESAAKWAGSGRESLVDPARLRRVASAGAVYINSATRSGVRASCVTNPTIR
jgi:hypothetical protein